MQLRLALVFVSHNYSGQDLPTCVTCLSSLPGPGGAERGFALLGAHWKKTGSWLRKIGFIYSALQTVRALSDVKETLQVTSIRRFKRMFLFSF